MITKDIITLLEDNKLLKAKEMTEFILSSKAEDAINSLYRESALDLFEKKAPVTKKDDDGDGMDPVGHGDDDIDNDGDSDSSDKYLKNRRKVVSKAIKKEDTDVPPILELISKVAQKKFGVRSTQYDVKSPEDKSRVKSRYYRGKEAETRDKEAERKRNERDKERRAAEKRVSVGGEVK